MKLIKNLFSFTYISLLILSFIFIALTGIYDRKTNTRQYYSIDATSTWEDYQFAKTAGQSCVYGKIYVADNKENIFAFYSTHQTISIMSNSRLLYQYPVENNNFLARTPGYAWHFVTLPQGENDIKIFINSPYEQYKEKIPVFFKGNYLSVISRVVSEDIISIIICSFILILGIAMIGYWIGLKRQKIQNDNLLYLGCFAIILSLWSINEVRFFVLITKNNIMSSYMAFLTLLFIPYPYARFVQSLYHSKCKIWDAYCHLSVIQIAVCILLQLLRIRDLREMLWTSHIMIITLAIIVMVHSLYAFLHDKKNKNILVHTICVLIYGSSLLIDIVAFYFGIWDNNFFGRIGLLLYIMIIAVYTINESTNLMKLGTKTKFYAKIAFTDQMTGLGSRAAFMRDIEKLEGTPENIAIINLDVNHLKRTNDNYSHLAGDLYIQEVGKLVSEVFRSIGKCYRIGGDEFEVILVNGAYMNIDKYLEKLDLLLEHAQWEGKMDWMQVSHGYAEYDARVDKSLLDTYKRADDKMYEDKAKKKQTE